ncbi:hypothetical protein [Paenibacillus maysiensis]|uniref:hypothetical protein n=1 Tax=Paenibacillus maysiensis TaxID=1155954 RepID=UPI0012DD5702|nr:hypothetical protein [Paenibacillus maysiensis]
MFRNLVSFAVSRWLLPWNVNSGLRSFSEIGVEVLCSRQSENESSGFSEKSFKVMRKSIKKSRAKKDWRLAASVLALSR